MLIHNFSEKLKISSGIERLAFFTAFYGIFIHVASCLFIMLAEMESELTQVQWITDCQNEYGSGSYDFEVYLCSCYFVMTTTSTVGYGDISPTTTLERVFGMTLMFFGVICFTFVSGALASILQSQD